MCNYRARSFVHSILFQPCERHVVEKKGNASIVLKNANVNWDWVWEARRKQ
jgi:hypothetical protein